MNIRTINIIYQESGCFNPILALAETGGRIKMFFFNPTVRHKDQWVFTVIIFLVSMFQFPYNVVVVKDIIQLYSAV